MSNRAPHGQTGKGGWRKTALASGTLQKLPVVEQPELRNGREHARSCLIPEDQIDHLERHVARRVAPGRVDHVLCMAVDYLVFREEYEADLRVRKALDELRQALRQQAGADERMQTQRSWIANGKLFTREMIDSLLEQWRRAEDDSPFDDPTALYLTTWSPRSAVMTPAVNAIMGLSHDELAVILGAASGTAVKERVRAARKKAGVRPGPAPRKVKAARKLT